MRRGHRLLLGADCVGGYWVLAVCSNTSWLGQHLLDHLPFDQCEDTVSSEQIKLGGDGYYSRLMPARVGSRPAAASSVVFLRARSLGDALSFVALSLHVEPAQLDLVVDIVFFCSGGGGSFLTSCIYGFWFICWFCAFQMEAQLSSVGRRSNADGLAFNEFVPLFQGLRSV